MVPKHCHSRPSPCHDHCQAHQPPTTAMDVMHTLWKPLLRMRQPPSPTRMRPAIKMVPRACRLPMQNEEPRRPRSNARCSALAAWLSPMPPGAGQLDGTQDRGDSASPRACQCNFARMSSPSTAVQRQVCLC
jgi:hypothetical protein